MARTTPTLCLLSMTVLAIAPSCVLSDVDPDDPTGDTSDGSSTEAPATDDTGGDPTTDPTGETEADSTGGDDDPIVLGCDAELPMTLVHTEGNAVDYRIDCDLRLVETLVVEQGTIIEVAPGVVVGTDGGRLVLKGTEQAPVVMRAQDPANPWGGLHFFGGTEQMSQLDFARIEDAGAATVISTAAITVGAESYGAGNVSIRDCVIDGSAGVGLSASLGVLEIVRTSILDSSMPVQVSVDMVGMIGEGNTFTGNDVDGIGVVPLIQPNNDAKTWAAHDVPYIIDDIGVGIGGENTIAPGVVIEMRGPGAMIDTGGGSLIAIGEPDARIEIGPGPDGATWNSLLLASTGNVLEFVDVRGGSGANNLFGQEGMVTLEANSGSTVEIRDCVFEGSAGWGLWLGTADYNQDIDTANTFMDNALGDIRFPE
jgi:hypothetical protein